MNDKFYEGPIVFRPAGLAVNFDIWNVKIQVSNI